MKKKQRRYVHQAQMSLSLDDLLEQAVNQTLPDPPRDGSCNIKPQIKGIINEMIRESGKSREEIAEEMIRILGNGAKISKAMIDGWTKSDNGEEKYRYIPLDFMYALEMACDSKAITEYFCKLHRGKFMDSSEDQILTLGQIQMMESHLATKKLKLMKSLAKKK